MSDVKFGSTEHIELLKSLGIEDIEAELQRLLDEKAAFEASSKGERLFEGVSWVVASWAYSVMVFCEKNRWARAVTQPLKDLALRRLMRGHWERG